MLARLARSAALWMILVSPLAAAEPPDTSRGDAMIAKYFRLETAKLADQCLADVKTLEDWTSRRDEYVRQLREMLGLDPWPERTPLNAQVTGKVEGDGFTVEKVVFQSQPSLYVTGNLFLPNERSGPLPTILYLCGHSKQEIDGVSYGNKVGYHHHGAWFARHGYVCLLIDTLSLGEIKGIHRGTGLEGMWWWNSRGYTPAGIEIWNAIRALDYLETRPEVDATKFGVTGRSGGGAYSWYLAAVDERIQVAVPVAGITDLQNHVVDGCVEGHCDCMYMVNTYRWDYPLLAALVAPRPLLITNTDKDHIFPLDGVARIHDKVRKIYQLYGADDKLGLQISEGPHKDIQELQVASFRWFNRFLKGQDELITDAAVKRFEPQSLKVLDTLPADEINATIQDAFVPRAEPPKVPDSPEQWATLRDGWMKDLREKVFAGWPNQGVLLDVKKVRETRDDGIRAVYEFNSQEGIRLTMDVVTRPDASAIKSIVVAPLDMVQWDEWKKSMADMPTTAVDDSKMHEAFTIACGPLDLIDADRPDAVVVVATRGVGPSQWTQEEPASTHLRRRFMLVGQTQAGMQVYDVLRAIAALRTLPDLSSAQITLVGDGDMATVALFASLFEPAVKNVKLSHLAATQRDTVDFLNVSKYLDLPQVVAMAADDGRQVVIETNEANAWVYPAAVAKALHASDAESNGGLSFRAEQE